MQLRIINVDVKVQWRLNVQQKFAHVACTWSVTKCATKSADADSTWSTIGLQFVITELVELYPFIAHSSPCYTSIIFVSCILNT